MSEVIHIPVLLAPTLELLNPEPGNIVLDGTVGFGGHAGKILGKIGNNGHLIGMDGDPEAIKTCQESFKNYNTSLIHKRYCDFPAELEELDIKKIDRFLLDLGISSFQLDSAKRGFSFQKDEALDMRMNPDASLTAATILNTYSAEKLAFIFREYGELKRIEKFISNLVFIRKSNQFKTTADLIQVIKKSFFFNNKRSAFIKTCTLVFQALRIEVNQELDCLKQFLANLETYAAPGSRVAIISFHSLEDRIVKYFIRDNKAKWRKITKSVITATQDEIRLNSRAKCAKLRVFEYCS